jgi:hypothetical protein
MEWVNEVGRRIEVENDWFYEMEHVHLARFATHHQDEGFSSG